jgi:hypothetical protein
MTRLLSQKWKKTQWMEAFELSEIHPLIKGFNRFLLCVHQRVQGGFLRGFSASRLPFRSPSGLQRAPLIDADFLRYVFQVRAHDGKQSRSPFPESKMEHQWVNVGLINEW